MPSFSSAWRFWTTCAGAYEADKKNNLPSGPTTFDAGVNRDGYKTYIIHGIEKVHIEGTQDDVSAFNKTFELKIPGPDGLGLVLDTVQATVSLAGFSSDSGLQSVAITSVNAAIVPPHDKVHNSISITVSGSMKGRGAVEMLQYTVFVSTKEQAPQADAISDLQKEPAALKLLVQQVNSDTKSAIKSSDKVVLSFFPLPGQPTKDCLFVLDANSQGEGFSDAVRVHGVCDPTTSTDRGTITK